MRRCVIGILVFVATSLGCQTIHEEMPSAPSRSPSTGPAPIPIVIVDVSPSPLPTPQPSTAPTPVPSPTTNPGPGPSPTPMPSSTPGTRACSLPPGGGSGHNCPRQEPSFLKVVESAMDMLVAQEPGLFDLNHTRGCGNCYYVRDATRYAQRVAELVRAQGYCAVYDGEELAVKNVNGFNDQYDILTADSFVRRQLGSYRATCYPAWF